MIGMSNIEVNAMGDACPIPVIKTRNAIREMKENGVVEVKVDNEIAVQNLTKLANELKYENSSEKLGDAEFKVTITVDKPLDAAVAQEVINCIPDARAKKVVVAIGADHMGEGNDELGAVLVKGFIFALTQQDVLPATILFYNGGAKLTCEGSPALEDLKSLEAEGVEILTCGTCLNYYELSDKLQVGEVTNMYVIAEKMMNADNIIKP
jgi:selenium metabolism protein YedF